MWSSLYWVGTFTTKLKWDKAIPAEEAHAKSEAAFVRLLSEYPDNDMADSARSQLGMIYFRNRQWEKAAAIYEEILKESPPGEKVPQSVYYLARSYRQLGQKEMARLAYEALIADWPDSRQAVHAREEIAELGGLER